jgi:oligopeptide transport system substrate-binding protein
MLDMFEGLMTRDAAGILVPGVAASSDISADGLIYTFKLRPGLMWSDGSPLTADDFVYAYRRAVTPANATQAARHFYPLKNARAILAGERPPTALGVHAPDQATVKLTLERPAAYFPEILAHSATVPLPRQAIERFGRDWTQSRHIVVNGPYTLSEWRLNSVIRLVRNPRFHAATGVKIDVIDYYPSDDTQAALTRFRANELDIVRNLPAGRLSWAEENYARELRREPVAGLYFLLVNGSRGALGDVRVRKALSISIDRAFIANTLIRESSGPAFNLVPAAMPGFHTALPAYSRTPIETRRSEARQLLAEAGFTNANPLKFEFKYGGLDFNRQTAVALQAMWKEVGVRADLVNLNTQVLNRDARARDFDVLKYNYFAPFLDPVAFLNLLRSDNSANLSAYENARYDAALDAADAQLDPVMRFERLREAEALVMADFPIIPIYFAGSTALVHQWVRGWVSNPRGDHPSRYLSLTDH